MSGPIRVLIVDSFPIVRWAVRSYLERERGIQVVGEASSTGEASRIALSTRPDVVILDTRFSGSDLSFDFVNNEKISALAFSDQDTWRDVEAFMNAGGLGFVSKRSPMSELVCAIRAVSENRQWISPRVRESAAIVETFDNCSKALSRREREVVALIADGLTSKQIADQLCLSLRTVENHRHRVFKKLGIQRSVQLVDYAIRNGLHPGASANLGN